MLATQLATQLVFICGTRNLGTGFLSGLSGLRHLQGSLLSAQGKNRFEPPKCFNSSNPVLGSENPSAQVPASTRALQRECVAGLRYAAWQYVKRGQARQASGSQAGLQPTEQRRITTAFVGYHGSNQLAKYNAPLK